MHYWSIVDMTLSINVYRWVLECIHTLWIWWYQVLYYRRAGYIRQLTWRFMPIMSAKSNERDRTVVYRSCRTVQPIALACPPWPPLLRRCARSAAPPHPSQHPSHLLFAGASRLPWLPRLDRAQMYESPNSSFSVLFVCAAVFLYYSFHHPKALLFPFPFLPQIGLCTG